MTMTRRVPMPADLVLLPCDSNALAEARGNLYRPPVVRVVVNRATIARFTVLAGACPLKIVERIGFRPARLLLRRGSLGERPKPDEIVVEVTGAHARAA